MNFLIIFILAASAAAIDFEIDNQRDDTVWIGIQGGVKDGVHKENLANGGFVLPSKQSHVVSTNDPTWEGRFWARTGCNQETNTCETGDCGAGVECNGNGGSPPATLAEIKLNGDGDQDYYDISLVDGFNVMAEMKPSNAGCPTVGCMNNINAECPNNLQVKSGDNVIACQSACLHYNTDQTCCRGQYNQDTCNPTEWPENSAKLFKDACPDAYSYAYDDHTGLKTCPTGSNYKITFS